MRDLNFFEPYIEKREFKFNKIMLLYSLLILTVIFITGFSVYNLFEIKALQNDIKERKVVADNPVTVKKVNEIKELELEVSTFKTEVEKIITLDQTIEAKDIIGEDLLIKVRTKMPTDLFLTNFSAYDREIQISGIAKDKYSIAEFSKGLEGIEDADSTFVSSITAVEDYYKFIMNLTLKEVITDEPVSD